MSDLAELSRGFASDVARALSAFAGVDVDVTATQMGSRFAISETSGSGVVVEVSHQVRLTVTVQYRCESDSAGSYLRVRNSSVAVFAGARPKGDPLFRFEYVADQSAALPCAHLHVHAHRDQFTRIMTLAGLAGSARRRPAPDAELEAARMSALHFPLGGHRFRPCLEDVLQFVAVEFGVLTGDRWPVVLAEGRVAWRRAQTAAAVRDCPSEAVRALSELGYRVLEPPAGPAADRLDRLSAF